MTQSICIVHCYEAEVEYEGGKGELTNDVLNLPSLWTLIHTWHAM